MLPGLVGLIAQNSRISCVPLSLCHRTVSNANALRDASLLDLALSIDALLHLRSNRVGGQLVAFHNALNQGGTTDVGCLKFN